MTILRFPQRPKSGSDGPRPIYVCAPSFDDMVHPKKKFGLGYSREEAKAAFYGGDPQSQHVEARVFTLTTAPGRLKHHIVSQLELFVAMEHPLSEVEEETRERLGNNPYLYSSTGPAGPKRKRLSKLFG